MQISFSVLTFILSFLIGSIPLGWILVKLLYGKDLHKFGSGNIGASNVLTTTHSEALTALVVLFDVGKGYFCMLIAQELGLPAETQMLAGIGAILGHNYSIFLKFSGGRGVLTSLGVYFFVSPWLGLIALLIAFGMAPFHQLALGTVLATFTVLIITSIFPELFNITNYEAVISCFSMISIILITRRLIAHRSPLSKNDPIWRIAICRILFDRDIPNRELWIHQDRTIQFTPTEEE